MQEKKFGFPISPALYHKVTELIKKVKAAKDKRPFALQLFDCIEEISSVGMDYLFVQPIKRAKLSMITTKTFMMAVNMGQSGILKVGKSLIKTLDNTQLMVIVDLLEEAMDYTQVNQNKDSMPNSLSQKNEKDNSEDI